MTPLTIVLGPVATVSVLARQSSPDAYRVRWSGHDYDLIYPHDLVAVGSDLGKFINARLRERFDREVGG